MVTALSILPELFTQPHVDMIGAAVADYEERRRVVVPFVFRAARHRAKGVQSPARMCRFTLRGGIRQGNGRRMLVAGRIVTGARS